MEIGTGTQATHGARCEERSDRHMRRRVVITGMGAITPLGNTVEALYRNQLEGKSGAGPITHFDAGAFPTQFAAEVKDFELSRYVKNPERWQYSGLNSKFAVAAAKQALTHAGVLENPAIDRTRFGVYLGSGEGVQDFQNLVSLIALNYDPVKNDVNTVGFAKGGLEHFHAGHEFEQELHTTPAHLADVFDLEGPNYNCLTACAASSQAVGEATEMI